MTEQLPSELAELFAAEKAAPAVSGATKVALRARIAKSVAHLPLGQAAATTALGGAGKVMAILAVVVGAGAGTVAVVRDRSEPAKVASTAPTSPSGPSPSLVAPPQVVAPPSSPSKVVAPPSPVVAPSPPPDVTPPSSLVVEPTTHATQQVAEPPPHVVPPARVAPNTSIATTPSQAALLARAWSALESGAADRALELSRRDEQLHPDGALREEREALAVVALAKLQRRSDAAAAGSQFIKDHPASVHRALVERSLRSEPSR